MSSVNRNRRSSTDSVSVVIRSFTSGIARRSSVEIRRQPGDGEEVQAARREVVVVERLDVVVVHPLELLGVEPRRVLETRSISNDSTSSCLERNVVSASFDQPSSAR